MENKFTPELIEKAKSAKTPEELLALAKENGIELTEDDIQMMNDWGMKVVLYLGEDGKATLDLFGEVQDSTSASGLGLPQLLQNLP